MARIPSLRRHKRGHFFFRQSVPGKKNPRDVYLGFDPVQAVNLWRAAVASQGLPAALPALPRPDPSPRRLRASKTLSEATSDFLKLTLPTVSPARVKVYRFEAAAMTDVLGSKLLSELTAEDLAELRTSLTEKYKPWSANARLSLARRVLRYAHESGLVAQLPPLKILQNVPVGETTPKALSPDFLRTELDRIQAFNSNLANILRLQFLTALRPFSIPELIHNRGHFESQGIFVLEKSKTEKKTGRKQRILLCPTALAILKQIEPAYDGGNLYRQACKKAGFGAPHKLRHSAAQTLANAEVESSLIEVVLGHTIPGAGKYYFNQFNKALRACEDFLAPVVSQKD